MMDLPETSARAAQQLREMGFDAAVLKGGFAAWRAQFPVETITQGGLTGTGASSAARRT